MKVLLIAPNIDGTDVGEAYVAYKWAEALSQMVDLTVLSFQRPERLALADQLAKARVVTWNEPDTFRRFERFNAMAKPSYPQFCRNVRAWLANALQNGDTFDVSHQIMPQAARYPIPLRHFPMPYLVGPLGGALSTPESFAKECESDLLVTRLRNLDRFRFRFDPWLRQSYSNAEIVLGVAPYMREVLAVIPLRRFEPVLELGVDEVAPQVTRLASNEKLRLLHVGRGVRTKGLRDAVRALALLSDCPDITLTSAGAGPEIEICKAEAKRLGVADRVRFLGRIPRDRVETLYRDSDVFLFPSFREPAGGVLYEAMRWGLPVITANRGGPKSIVDAGTGIKVDVTDPERFAHDIASAVRRLLQDAELRHRLGEGARNKIAREGVWGDKASALVELYKQAIESNAARAQ
jgi:glycosyltransferase involved in cell wall biosynthesis